MGYSNCKKIFEDNGGTGLFPQPNCLEGFNLPTFNAISTLNDSINTKKLKGKPTVINLWFVGCPPCEAEVPGLNQLANKYYDKVNFIAIGRNSDKYLSEFLENNEWTFKHINDPNEEIIRNSFNHVWGFPTTFIADKNGKIVKAFSGGKTDSTAVQSIINEIEPTLKAMIN
jgi:peroxiredoxin